MGRIKKPAKEGHDATLSPFVSEFISKCSTEPLHLLPAHLATFPKQWGFPKSDLHSWIPVLNRFDHILELIVAEYGLGDGPQTRPFATSVLRKGDAEKQEDEASQEKLQELGHSSDGDCKLAKDVLDFSAFLLEHSSNRGLYSSQDHINNLLNTTSLSLLKSVLNICLPLAVRFFANKQRYGPTNSSHHLLLHSHFNINLDRLQKIAASFAKKTGPSSHYDAIAGKGKQKDTESLHNPNDISFFLKSRDLPESIRQSIGDVAINYYDRSAVAQPSQRYEQPASPASPTPVRKSSNLAQSSKADTEEASSRSEPINTGPKVFQLSATEVAQSSLETILSDNVHKLPAEHKYDLLQQVRVARGFRGNKEDLQDIISCRILAVANLAYTCLDSNFHQRIGQVDSEQPKDFQLVYQLADLLQPVDDKSEPISKEVVIYANNALEALVKVKSKCNDVAAALNVSVSHGILFYAFRQVIASLEANIDTTEEREWRHSVITLVHALASPPNSYSRNSDQMVAAGVIGLWIHALFLRTSEAQAFYSDIIHFLDIFVNNGVRDSFQSLVNCRGLEVIAGLTADMVTAALEELENGQGMPDQFKTKVTDYDVSFFKQQALRQVLKFVLHMFSLNVGNDRHLRNLIDTPQLLGALKTIIARPKIFGSNIWISAVSIVSSFIHSEPTSYNIVHEAGLVAGILDAVAPPGASNIPESGRILPVGETLRDIPTAFGAICLNEAGMKLFRNSEALNTYLGIFISLDHVEALENDPECAVSIGNAFDELVRHHPELKDMVHNAVLRMVNMVVTHCQERAERKGAGAKLWIAGPDGTPYVAGGKQAMAGPKYSSETAMSEDGDDSPVPETFVESDALTNGRTSGRSTSDVISVLCKFLQGFLSNSSMMSKFCEEGGVVSLLELAMCPCNPWNFHELSTYDEITRVFLQVQESKSHLLLPLLVNKTKEALAFLRPLIDAPRDKPYFEALTRIHEIGEFTSPEAVRIKQQGTAMAKGLVAVQSLVNLLADLFMSQTYYGQRSSQHNYFTQINLTDLYVQLVDGLGRLHSSCLCELIFLQNHMPEDWKQQTKVKGVGFSNAEADNVMGQVSAHGPRSGAAAGNDQSSTDQQDSNKKADDLTKKYPAVFKNNEILRHLFSQIPASIISLLQQLGKSLFTKGRSIMDGWQRQNAATVAEHIAKSFIDLLDAPFSTESSVLNLSRYQIVVISTMIKVFIDKRPYRSNQPEILVTVLNQFHLQGGFTKLNNWLFAFYEHVKGTRPEDNTGPESQRAYSVACLGSALEFYSKVASAKIIENSPQGTSLSAHALDPSYAGFYDPAQLLIEIRSAVFPIVKEIWSPEDGSMGVHLDSEDMRSVVGTLKSILAGDGEAKARNNTRPRAKPTKRKWKPKNSESIQNLVNSGIPRDLAIEALFRCNDNMNMAREYSALRQNEEIEAVDRLPPPEGELETSPSPSRGESRQQSQPGESSAAALARVPSVEMQDADEDDQSRTDNDDIMSDDDPSTSIFGSQNGVLDSLATRTSGTLNIDSDTGNEVTVSELPSHQRESSDAEKADMVTVEDLDKKRKIVRENLVDRCIDVLNELTDITFDIAELIQAATSTSRPESKELKESIGETLTMSLVSLSADDTPQRNKKVSAVAHLLALVLQERDFFETTIDTLKSNFDDFVQLLKVAPDASFEESTPYLSNVLLVMERMLIEDEQPHQIAWQVPLSDAPQDLPPLIIPPSLVDLQQKELLFAAIIELLPRIGKNELFALSVMRVLVMLTRRRQIAKKLSQKPNIGRLFLMVKQLAGLANDQLQSAFLTILRHMVEDEDIIRQIMRTEVQNFFEMSRTSRAIDCSAFARHLYPLVLRDPDIFVQVTEEKVELTKWDPHSRPQVMALKKDQPAEDKPKEKTEEAVQSTEQSTEAQKPQLERTKTSDMKPPVVENPDGVIQFILKELSSYRDVDDKETPAPAAQQSTAERSETPDVEMPDMTPPPDLPRGTQLPIPQPKTERTIFKTEEHPIFTYRCTLLQCLSELLCCYNRTKVEFINFSPKSESTATTPSKPRSGLLNYMLTTLVPVGTLQHQDDVAHRKKTATSTWAISAIVGLCAKTQEYATALRPGSDRSLEDETELVYVRRFVLEQVLKALNSAMHSTEPLDMRYSRLLGLSDIINKMLIGKPSSPSAQINTDVVIASTKNISKLMYEKNFVSALTAAVAEIDLNFPNAKRAIKYILRPLKWLTDTAVQLSLTSDSTAPGSTEDDDISSATSITSDESDERDATPDIFRNSTLGQFEPGREESESSEDDDGEEYYGDDYDDDEMDYEDERPLVAHGDVVSDDEDEGMGPIEGVPGDVNMDVEIVMDESGGESDDDDEDDDDDDDEDDDEDDEDGDESGSVEIIDEITGDGDNDSGAEDIEGEDEEDWEDDDGEHYEEDDIDDGMFPHGRPLDTLARVMGDDDRSDLMDRLNNAGVTLDQGMEGDYFEDEMPPEDDEDEVEDYDEEVVYEPEVEFEEDDDDDDDEDGPPFMGGAWGQPDPSRFFRHHHHHHHTRIPPDPWGSRDAPFEAYTSMRSHRPGMSGRGNDDGSNPLLHRNDSRGVAAAGRLGDQPFSETLFAEHAGGPRGPGRNTGRPEMPSFLADLLQMVGPPGGSRLEFIPDRNGGFSNFAPMVISAGPGGLSLPHLRHSRPGTLSNILRQNQRQEGPLPLRPPTHDPGQAVSFMPALTISRWQEEARLLFGQQHQSEAVKITNSLLRVLTPPAMKVKRKRDKEEAEKKAAAEKAQEEARKKAEEERKEREEQERKEREEREAKEAEEAAQRARDAAEQGEGEATDAPMQGVEETQPEAPSAAEPALPAERITYMVRGSEVDISNLGIDRDFLDEIPEDMREDVIMAQLQQRLEQRPQQEAPPAAAQPATQTQVPEEIDREFLDALPSEIRQELLRAEASERNRREREEARRRITASGSGEPPQPEEMNNADFMAMLEPSLRQSVLMDAGDDVIAALPANLRAEAEALFGGPRRGMPRMHELVEGRRSELTRQPPAGQPEQRVRRPVVQILDKAGVATLLRLMFVALTGSARTAMLGILSDICRNTQNRAEVISILLSILQDGSADSAALDRSFTQLTMRAKQLSGPKTPQPLRRTLTGQQVAPLNNEASPLMIVQQCLSALTALAHDNPRIASFFLTEHETISSQRTKTPKKGKGKDVKSHKYPINALLTLLDRRTIIENSSVMEHLAGLLVRITEPLKAYLRRAKEEEKKTEQAVESAIQPADATAGSSGDVAMSEVNQTEQPATEGADTAVGEKKDADNADDKKKPKDAPPPDIPEENLCLVVNIIAARECSGKTFQNTLDIVNHLSAIPGARNVFGKELVRRAQELGVEVLGDLQQLPQQIRDAQSSTEMQGRALAAFSPGSSHQNKLLRVLLALDYIFDPKRINERSNPVTPDGLAQKVKEDLIASLYNDSTFVKLWNILSECLTAIRERGNMNNVATILQPLIEAFMVVCKSTAAKEVTVASPKDVSSPPPDDRIESLFFRFTEDHRKILNDLVRHNPKLMSGTFDVLVKNSKVLEFDNKRSFFNKRLHTRSADERVPHQTLQLNVRRSEVFLDSFKSLFFKKPNEIKYGKLNIRFAGEEGVDAGGVTREWFAAMSRQMFNPNYALFNPVAADRTTFHPNPLSAVNEQHLTFFKFIGRIIGKALYENRVLDCHFSRAVYKRILGKNVSLKDMETLDLDYYKSLMWMLENDITDVAFESFSVEVDRFGETETVDLKPNGRNIPVTEDNKQEYVKLVVEQRLTKSVEEQLEHFLIGFREIVPLELISIFNEQELELLISGLPDIDVDDWKNNTEYHNYTQTSPQVQWFWRAVRSFEAEEKAKLLQFVTGTSKVPLNGFKELEGMNGFSRFNIHRDFGNKDRLPSSHTCFNQLDLPEYESYEALRKQLYTAMTVGSDHFGFA